MIKNSKIINGLVGDSIVLINLETNNISLNSQDQQWCLLPSHGKDFVLLSYTVMLECNMIVLKYSGLD